MFTGLTYLFLGGYFLITSLNIIRELKLKFKFFYEENRKQILLVSIGLTLPLFFRGIIDTWLCYATDSEYAFLEEYEDYYNSFMIFVCDGTLYCS